MPRKTDVWNVKRRRGYWYMKVRGDGAYQSTGIRIDNWKQTKPKAERYAQQMAAAGPAARRHETFGEYAAPYFLLDSCPWYQRQIGRGNHILEFSLAQLRSLLVLHILPQFKRFRPEELSPVGIAKWLYALDYSSQTKKHIYRAFGIILRDMHAEKLITFSLSDIDPPIVSHGLKEIPTDAEASLLFPADFAAFRDRWGPTRWHMGVMLALAYSTGLRNSEARALELPAIHWGLGGLVVVVTINRDGRPGAPKAKSVRAIPMPRWTQDLIRYYLDAERRVRTVRGDTYVFPGRVRESFLDIGSANHALHAVCAAAGINTALTPHGLRHAYNTRMRAILAESEFGRFFDEDNGFQTSTAATDAVLRAFTGHKTPNMTELYDHPELLKALQFFDKNFRTYVEQYWHFRDEIEKAQKQGPTRPARKVGAKAGGSSDGRKDAKRTSGQNRRGAA